MKYWRVTVTDTSNRNYKYISVEKTSKAAIVQTMEMHDSATSIGAGDAFPIMRIIITEADAEDL